MSVDDDGYDACALTREGFPICWGSDASAGSHAWSQTPSDHAFKFVTVGRTRSPLSRSRSYACGLDTTEHVRCWEDGVDGRRFELPGTFSDMDAGNNTVCGIRSGSGVLACVDASGSFNARPAFRRPLEAVSLGIDGVGCIAADARTHCWGIDGMTLVDLGVVRMMRAGRAHVCSLDAAGQMRCFGDYRPPPKLRFRFISRPDNVSNYCGITLDGETYCWGDPAPDPADT